MVVYRIAACSYINDLSGEGAYLHGGRWNSPGTRLLYTAENPALAMLEALAHITMVALKRPYCLLALEVPENLEILPLDQLRPDWQQAPAPKWQKTVGDKFVEHGQHLVLQVPSVLLPGQYNFLINPGHALGRQVRIREVTPVSFDQRLVQKNGL